MEIKQFVLTLGVLLLIIIIAATSFMGNGPDIAKAVSDKFPLKSTNGYIHTYQSPDNANKTVNTIVSIKRPYDQKVEAEGKSILLYDEAVLVVEEKDGITEIELIEDHQVAYNHHRNTMIFFWGGNLYQNGRIRTPRSIRNGSIGSSSNRGGGFGFGK